jgi:hypothetical protein
LWGGLSNFWKDLEQSFLAMIHDFDRQEYDVGLFIETGQILFRVVTRFVQATRVKKAKERRFGGWKVIFPGKPRARSETPADFRFRRSGQIFDNCSFAALGSAEHPEDRDRGLMSQFREPTLEAWFTTGSSE